MSQFDGQIIGFHTVFWLTLNVVWLLSTTANHPNWTLAVSCTSILTLASAVFAYCYMPHQRTRRALLKTLAALLACGVTAALVIHAVYDAMIGPDPRRFGLLQNIGMDTAIILFNTVVALTFASILSRVSGNRF